MRVAHIITGLGVGGAEQQLRLLLRHLPARCDVFTLSAPGAVARGILADGHRVTHVGMRSNRDATVLPLLVHLLREGRYDVVHTHLYRACLYGRLAARLAGVRAVVATEHSLGESSIEGRPLGPGVRALYLASERLGRATVAVSAAVERRLRRWGVPAARLHTVPNGIDAHRFRYDPAARTVVRELLGLPEQAMVVGGVGRLVPGKNFATLIRAVAQLPDAQLLLAGDGPERDALGELARGLGAGERVHLLGECTDERRSGPGTSGDAGHSVPELLSAMDVFVSPSSDETFGLAALEALASGLPLLHAACPALDDLPPGEAPGARRIGGRVPELTALLCEFAEHRPERLPVPPVVERYDIARSAERLMEVYRAAMDASRRTPARAAARTAGRASARTATPSQTPTPSRPGTLPPPGSPTRPGASAQPGTPPPPRTGSEPPRAVPGPPRPSADPGAEVTAGTGIEVTAGTTAGTTDGAPDSATPLPPVPTPAVRTRDDR